ncbi:MltA domain-containing protein [Fulvimarina sp. 2208YS6-2-32]|uniref:peptidoglycan lytic exotransglycosylase n=1 Tax=Fulvimarina uroteuthidis TaxID=3098149 RepID=A0ABU5I1W4_9HYPH|nr:MltA domain-containing protein [Fulvimarina sp. 2208YS6-2-32]MDY8108978.1 MltA domain-containing protein [Fulvimarina sp. 2208YS6-2-32]
MREGDLAFAEAFAAFRKSAEALLAGAYPMGSLGIEPAAYVPAARAALSMTGARSDKDARDFFLAHFTLLDLRPEPGSARERGFVTGYYEPEVEASPTRTGAFRFPLYARPDDLVPIDAVSRPPGMDEGFRFARRMPSGLLEEYPDRAAIEAGFLEGRGLELAWLKSPVDAFFIHIQGSARLRMSDGGVKRVGYAGKTGHPFTAIGKVLVESGELSLDEAGMDGIRGWLDRHPDRLRALFDRNRSFIFFAVKDVPDGTSGPIGAANVPLFPLASIAVDRERATYGVPYLIDASRLVIEGKPYRRIAIAQDTGSAILGNARADLFVGSGEAAGEIAGRVRHAAGFSVLVPHALAARLAS